jgi:hypothetical protein
MTERPVRQLRWEVVSRDQPERHEYTLLLINKKREFERILQRASEWMRPAEEPRCIGEDVIIGTGLRYKLVTILAYRVPPNQINWSKIYGGKVTRDLNLGPREISDGLLDYVENSIASGKFS